MESADTPLSILAMDTIAKVREPLGLDQWQLHFEARAMPDARAACEASPEYREAVITFDFDKLKTGDDIDEVAVHELTHCHTWGLHTLAEELADALAECAPPSHRKALRELLREQVRKAAEETTVTVGHTYLRLLRRAGILARPESA